MFWAVSFAQIMIDAVHLLLREDRVNLEIQLPGRVKIPAERLFNDDPPPALHLGGHAGRKQISASRTVIIRGRGQIVKPICRFFLHISQRRIKLLIIAGSVHIALNVSNISGKIVPDICVESSVEVLHAAAQSIPELIVAPVSAGESHDPESGRKALLLELL